MNKLLSAVGFPSSKFKSQYTLEKRKQRSRNIRNISQFFPVILQSSFLFQQGSTEKNIKYLQLALTPDFSYTSILEYIRRRYGLNRSKSILLQVINGKGKDGGRIFSNCESIKQIYEKYADQDGFLYFQVKFQSAF